jgi:hypothetical protein
MIRFSRSPWRRAINFLECATPASFVFDGATPPASSRSKPPLLLVPLS